MLLAQTLSTDAQLRQNGAHELIRLNKMNYSSCSTELFDLLTSEKMDDNLRVAAGIHLKNTLSTSAWSLTYHETKVTMRTKLLLLLDTKNRNVANVVSQVIAVIAIIDLPKGHWKDLIDNLVHNVIHPSSSYDLKQYTLQTIGYICESLDPNMLSVNQCNSILTAIVDGARREQRVPEVQLAAIRALYNSLEFTQRNFEKSRERNFIMNVLCDGATPSMHSSVDLQVSSYECLNRIMQLYYDTMDDGMCSSLFNLTVFGMIRSDEEITLQAIEFWCTVAEMEINLNQQKSKHHSYCNQAVKYILPSLFKLVVKKKPFKYDDDLSQERNIPNASSHCLTLLAQCCRELVIPQTIEFITDNLFTTISDWNQREAAIIAFGCIIEGPCKYKTKQLVNEILPTILESLKDPNTFIRVSASWTLSHIIQHSIQVLDSSTVLPDMIPMIIEGVYAKEQKIVYNSCLCLIHLAKELKVDNNIRDEAIVTSGPLSRYTRHILEALYNITKGINTTHDTKCKNTIYYAMCSIIMHCPQDCEEIVYLMTNIVLKQLTQLTTLAEIEDYDDDHFWVLYTNLLGVLTSCVQRLGKASDGYGNKIMMISSEIIRIHVQHHVHTNIIEDAFKLVSALLTTTGIHFARHVDTLIQSMCKTLKKTESDRLSMIIVEIISDLCCIFGDATSLYANDFMQILLHNLKSETLDRQVKPMSLSCIGDVAHALGPRFKPFVEIVMIALKQAGNLQPDKKDPSKVKYIDAIRVGTLEAFEGILQGLDEKTRNSHHMLPHVLDIILFMNNIALDKSRSDRLTSVMTGVLSDTAIIYGNRIKSEVLQEIKYLIV